MNFSVRLRTYQEGGLIMFHKFSSDGHMKMFLQVSHNSVPTLLLCFQRLLAE